eukprot:TRINITY_DN457_c0_g4_i2.p1 TRINITY_DN457_c0_g4~~TRINITY_DN457_c0_g4_i2.p1  ORF type:complete len:614 (+),score=93.43 TRINITY_DN457_c0_g4_i2:232-1842(+)
MSKFSSVWIGICLLILSTLLCGSVVEGKKGKGKGDSSGSGHHDASSSSAARGDNYSCFLEKITYNSDICSSKWIITMIVFGGFLIAVLLYLIVLGNLSRSPWNKTMVVQLERLFEQNIQEGSGDVPAPPNRLEICERCGTSSHLRELDAARSGSVVLCAGCIGFKLMLRFTPALLFTVPAAFMCINFDLGGSIFLAEAICGVGIFIILVVVTMMLVWNRQCFRYMISCRASPNQDEEGARFQRLQRVLDTQSTNLLASVSSAAHRNAIHALLQDDEEIVWLQKVPFSLFVKHNYDFQLLMWSFLIIPALWGVIGVLSLLYERGREDVAFGLWVTGFVVVFSAPYLIAAFLRCRVIYVITNLRVMRINTTMLGNTRVYSFPYHRMSVFYVLIFPNALIIPETPTQTPTETQRGKIGWSLWADEDTFTCFEFVPNVNEVENLITRYATPNHHASISVLGTDFDVDAQKAQAKLFFLIQLIPLLILPLVALGAAVFDSIDWGFLLVVLSPIIWTTIFFHLCFRKYFFLSHCTTKVYGLQ